MHKREIALVLTAFLVAAFISSVAIALSVNYASQDQAQTVNQFKVVDLEGEATSRYGQQKEWLNKTIQNSDKVFELNNSHFVAGSVVIDDEYIILADESGQTTRVEQNTDNMVFKLSEDIEFNPNRSTETLQPYESGYVRRDQYAFYDPQSFGIGFFAAVVVQADNVVLDLNGHTLEQSREHSLQQRFFSLIELASQPFIPSQGPADFGASITSAQNVAVVNGHLGRSSHHAVHGQLPSNVLIEGVTMKDFEVAAISLHGAKDVSIVDADIQGNNKDIEVLGLWSSLRFIKPYVEQLPDSYSIVINGQTVTKQQMVQALREANNAVIAGGNWQSKYPYFVNTSGLTDGNVYGVLFNPKGVAVNGFHDTFDATKASEDILMDRVRIRDLAVAINEVPALNKDGEMSGAQSDVVGSVIQVQQHMGDGGVFTGTVDNALVQIAQIMVAKAISENVNFGFLPVDRNSISEETVAWAEGKTGFEYSGLRMTLNGDSMHHVNKGIVAVRVDGTNRAFVKDMEITNIQNVSEPCLKYAEMANYPELTAYERSYDAGEAVGIQHATASGAGANDTRGFALSSSQYIQVENLQVDSLSSTHGPSFATDVQFDSDFIDIDIAGEPRLAANVNTAAPGSTEASASARISVDEYQYISID